MADWVCTERGEEKGRVEEGEGEGKENGNVSVRKHIRVTREQNQARGWLRFY